MRRLGRADRRVLLGFFVVILAMAFVVWLGIYTQSWTGRELDATKWVATVAVFLAIGLVWLAGIVLADYQKRG